MARLLTLLVACFSVLATRTDGFAADRAISATKLTLKRSASGNETLTFVSKDPAYPYPLFGGADDPASGTPGGCRLELFTAGPTSATFDMPAGNGELGWTAKDRGTSGTFRFTNTSAPNGFSAMRRVSLRKKFTNGRRVSV